jgi:SAM-dependent methyltransferase
MNATAPPKDLRERYEFEKLLASHIRAARPCERGAVTTRAYTEYFRRFPRAGTPGAAGMGITPGKLALLRRLLSGRPSILEIGCGYGETLEALAPGRTRAVGLDTAESVIQDAETGPVRFEVGSGVEFDFGHMPFDAAYSVDLVEHLHPDDLTAHLASVYRSLRPGGRYVVMTPHRWTGPHDISRFFNRVATGFHLHEYTYGELRRASWAIGFRHIVSPVLPMRLASAAPGLVRAAVAPAVFKLPLEQALAALPNRAFRTLAFKAASLQTVCLVMQRPLVGMNLKTGRIVSCVCIA